MDIRRPTPFAAAMAEQEDQRGGDGGPINLWVADPGFETDPRIVEAFDYAVRRGCTHYFPAAGFDEFALPKAVAKYYLDGFGANLDPLGEVSATHGAQEALSLSIQACTRPGDEIIVPEPTYSVLIEKLEIFGVKPVFVSLMEEDSWRLDPGAIASAVTDKTRMIFVCNPNNPTGTVCSREDMDALAAILRANRGVSMLLDECYARILYDGGAHRTLLGERELMDQLFVVGSFSKAYAMTGWRLGYVVAGKKNTERIKRLSFEYNGGVSYAVQYAGAVALGECSDFVERMVGELTRRRRAMLAGLSELRDVPCVVPQAGFEVFPDFSAYSRNSKALVAALEKEARVKTMPGVEYGPSGEGHIRLVFCSEDSERISEGISRIGRCLPPRRS